MNERMLMRERNVSVNTCLDEDIVGMMELMKRILKGVEILGRYCIMMGNEAKVQEGRETLDHI